MNGEYQSTIYVLKHGLPTEGTSVFPWAKGPNKTYGFLRVIFGGYGNKDDECILDNYQTIYIHPAWPLEMHPFFFIRGAFVMGPSNTQYCRRQTFKMIRRIGYLKSSGTLFKITPFVPGRGMDSKFTILHFIIYYFVIAIYLFIHVRRQVRLLETHRTP